MCSATERSLKLGTVGVGHQVGWGLNWGMLWRFMSDLLIEHSRFTNERFDGGSFDWWREGCSVWAGFLFVWVGKPFWDGSLQLFCLIYSFSGIFYGHAIRSFQCSVYFSSAASQQRQQINIVFLPNSLKTWGSSNKASGGLPKPGTRFAKVPHKGS